MIDREKIDRAKRHLHRRLARPKSFSMCLICMAVPNSYWDAYIEAAKEMLPGWEATKKPDYERSGSFVISEPKEKP